MTWRNPAQDPAAAAAPRRRRGLLWSGLVIGIASLVLLGVSVVQVVGDVSGPLRTTLSGPVHTTPVDTRLSLDQGRHSIFVHTDSPAGGTLLSHNDVRITGQDGTELTATPIGHRETVTRGSAEFEATLQFDVPRDGSYRVVIDPAENLQVLVAPSLVSSFSGSTMWLVGIPAGGLGAIVGLVLFLVGLFMRRRQPAVGSASSAPFPAASAPSGSALPPPGWYPDPQHPGRQRFWDGQQWGQSQ